MPDIIIKGLNLIIGGVPPIFSGSHPSWGDEYMSFSNWDNFINTYNVVGNNVDITTDLQTAFTAIGDTASPVLWIAPTVPTTYEISSTVNLIGKQNISILTNGNVTFKWTGGDDGVMFIVDGVAYSRLFHNAKMKGSLRTIHIKQAWNTTGTGNGRVFDTGNSYLDITFEDGAQAITLGFDVSGHGLGVGGAETLIDRCRFYRLTAPNSWANGREGGGIFTGNYNALDTWVRNCYFEDCLLGVSNNSGAGNFHLSKCIFINNYIDIRVQYVEQFSARECFTNNPEAFYYAGFTGNSGQTIIQKNIMVDVERNVNNFPGWSSIYTANLGPLIGLDNTFKLFPTTNDQGSEAQFPQYDGSFAFGGNQGEITSIGTITTKVKTNHRHSVFQLTDAGRYLEYQLSTVTRESISSTTPELPPLQIQYEREIFEVPLGTTNLELADIFTNAMAFNGLRPIIHFHEGTHNVTFTIPQSDIQIVGDGYGTVITGDVTIVGPNKCTVRDISLKNVFISNVNQSNSRVYFDELQFFFNNVKGIEITNVNIPVTFCNSGFPYGTAIGVKINGGTGTHLFYGCQGMQEATHFDITNGKLHIAAYWAEKTTTDPFIHAKGGSEITFSGGRIATEVYQAGVMEDPIILIEGNNNKFTTLGINLSNYIKVTGNNNEVLAISNLLTTPYIVNTGTGNDIRGTMNLYRTTGNVGEPLADIGVIDETFATNMLATSRALNVPQLAPTPDGTCDIRFFRVRIQSSTEGLQITG